MRKSPLLPDIAQMPRVEDVCRGSLLYADSIANYSLLLIDSLSVRVFPMSSVKCAIGNTDKNSVTNVPM
jgi:hypothetical protein